MVREVCVCLQVLRDLCNFDGFKFGKVKQNVLIMKEYVIVCIIICLL